MERWRGAKVIEGGQLEKKQCPLSPTNLMMHQFPPAANTPVLPQLLSNSGHIKHTHRQTHKHTDRSPANRNSISLLFLCLLFISWIPREASKAALSVSPLTVLCVCHSSLVKIKSHNHTCTHTHTLTPPSPSWEFPVVKLFHLDGNFFFCHYPL